MPIAEVYARVLRQVRVQLRKFIDPTKHPPVNSSLVGRPYAFSPVDMLSKEHRALLSQEADAYLGHRFRFLNLEASEHPMDWHLDHQSGCRAPLKYAPSIPYRDPRVVGNVRNIWEKNRLHHVTVLAAAFAASQDTRYADAAEEQLISWIAANPVLRGVNWVSSLELAIRVIALTWIERLLRGSDSHARLYASNAPLWTALYWHQRLIYEDPSVGSSANNHLIGEMAGLFIGATALPVFPESARWARSALRILESEIERQTFTSGLNREQASAYHLFVLEFLLLVFAEMRAQAAAESPIVRSTLQGMLGAMNRLQDCRGNFVRFGDGDEGKAVQLRASATDRVKWIESFAASMGIETSREARIAERDAFADAGIYVLTSHRASPDEIFCVADAGPLGFLSLAAHGHADALSFSLHVSGRPIIVDCGTYSYYSEAHWRSYFRSTQAHNTIVIDGVDQSVQAGPFLWTNHAKCSTMRWTAACGAIEWCAQHDGYTRLNGSPIHVRGIRLQDNRVDIDDEVRGELSHEIEWRLHFAPECEVVIEGDACIARWRELTDQGTSRCRTLVVRLDSRLIWRLARGEYHAGRYSEAFNLLDTTTTLIGGNQFWLPARFHHSIEIS